LILSGYKTGPIVVGVMLGVYEGVRVGLSVRVGVRVRVGTRVRVAVKVGASVARLVFVGITVARLVFVGGAPALVAGAAEVAASPMRTSNIVTKIATRFMKTRDLNLRNHKRGESISPLQNPLIIPPKAGFDESVRQSPRTIPS
jgi:hypothetical protein